MTFDSVTLRSAFAAIPHTHTLAIYNTRTHQGLLGGAKIRNLKTNELTDVPLSGIFFAIGEC